MKAPDRWVAFWLWLLVALVIAMVAIGGATRLTGSGLSITEWKPVAGALPPLSRESWLAEFAKYRSSPQYALLNQGMSLADFQFIYAWEWAHRQFGRLIGLVFAVPFLVFWWKGLLSRKRIAACFGIGVFGFLQAMIGWIMVASGLRPGMVAVAPLKLMLHLIVASLILSSLVWLAAGADHGSHDDTEGRGRRGSKILLALVFLQIALGGLVAGSKAGSAFNTWPLMDGRLIPESGTLFAMRPWPENFIVNIALVQFDHRLAAYGLLAFAVWHMMRLRSSPGFKRAAMLTGSIGGQALLGIVTLLLAVPLWAGLMHQITAMLVLCLATFHVRKSQPARA